MNSDQLRSAPAASTSASNPMAASEPLQQPLQQPNGRLAFGSRQPDELIATRLAGREATSAGQEASAIINCDPLVKYVNLVRNMTAQHGAELIVLCVIIIYLVYYFSKISKVSELAGPRPKLAA